MNDRITFSKLDSADAWAKLRGVIDPTDKNLCATGLMDHLIKSGACSAIVEEEYLDQDFTSSYSAFYSKVFKRHTKICRRFHFFNSDITPLFKLTSTDEISEGLRTAGAEKGYLGFIVIRPIRHAPIGRSVIVLPPDSDDSNAHLLVYAKYKVHLLGVELQITGMQLTQQDSRVGACAQASIWMAARHFHNRHRGPWYSTVDITEAATKIPDALLAQTLPVGAEFLSPSNMVQALRQMGREPFTYQVSRNNGDGGNGFSWGNLRPYDIINRYVDSGMPVILGLFANGPSATGHAVVVTGHTITSLPNDYNLPNRPTRAEFCDCFLVNDDQRGANLKLPIKAGSHIHSESPFNIEENVHTIIVPLPEKVYIPAEHAEEISWGLIKEYENDWPNFIKSNEKNLGNSIELGNHFVNSFKEEKIIARTYLTYGWQYRNRMLKNVMGDDYKNMIFYHDFPRYVWVTEFGTFASLNHANTRDRRILGHSAIDATASKYWESRCVFHAPGMAKRWYHNPDNNFDSYIDTVSPIFNDIPYYPKIRGDSDFSHFQ